MRVIEHVPIVGADLYVDVDVEGRMLGIEVLMDDSGEEDEDRGAWCFTVSADGQRGCLVFPALVPGEVASSVLLSERLPVTSGASLALDLDASGCVVQLHVIAEPGSQSGGRPSAVQLPA